MVKPKTKHRRKPKPDHGAAVMAAVEAGVAVYKLVQPLVAKARKARVKKAKLKKAKVAAATKKGTTT